MAEEKPNGESQEDAPGPQWEHFKDVVRRIAAVPKEELDEKLAEEKREKEEKQAR